MNKFELSPTTWLEDAFIAAPAYKHPCYWDKSLNENVQDKMLCRDECCGDQVSAVLHGARRVKEREIRPRPEFLPADLGLWPLRGSSNRHNQWEHLRRIPGGNVLASYFGPKYSSSLLKRACDVIGSLVSLIMLSPLFVLVAIVIKLDSPGPVFFRHCRVGKGGRHFVLWKFRSMKEDAFEYEVSPRSIADGRLTRAGRLIRRLSIDEMPQLFNVLKGDMSLVGPRPEMPFIVARYHPAHCERLVARPGITGLWQISPARAFPIHENLSYDLHYIHNQNLVLDVAIILRTITAVIYGVGAV
jgi:lipopolysaccharide/colanic/teichoic acid biosynthesis glycosyltransferase